MLQLDLFGGPALDEGPLAAGLGAEGAAELAEAIEPLDPRQMGLFDARAAQLRAARAAVAREELEGARLLLEDLTRGDDPDVRRGLAVIAAVQERIGAAGGMPAPARAMALLACADELEDAAGLRDALRALLLRRAARAVQADAGDDACIAGWPVGVYLARAGDLAAARMSLTAALARARRARTLCALGDVATLEGDSTGARDWYCEALARDPFDAEAVSAIGDRAILELPDIARYELDIDPYPEAWSAPLGLVTGVFRIPRAGAVAPVLTSIPADVDAIAGAGAARSHAQLDALAAAQDFTAALVAAEATTAARPSEQPDIIRARREMKRLQPALFAAYLERKSGRSGVA